jgi:hypothetical protein
MLQNLTNFKSLFNNLNNLENFQDNNVKIDSPKYSPEKPEKKLFTPILMPYDFESNDPIGDLFKGVSLDGNVRSPKKQSKSKTESEVSLITECPPGYKAVGDINVNSTYLNCRADGSAIKSEPKHRFLSEKNSCVFKAKFQTPNSAVASTLMPKPSNDKTETETSTPEKEMVTKSGSGTRVFSDIDRQVTASNRQASENKSVKKISKSESVKSKTSDKKMVTKSAKADKVLSTVISKSISNSASPSSMVSSSPVLSSTISSSIGSSSLGSTSTKKESKSKKNDVNSYKTAVAKAAKEKYTTTEMN